MGLLDRNQHSFRGGMSCNNQLLEIMEAWTKDLIQFLLKRPTFKSCSACIIFCYKMILQYVPCGNVIRLIHCYPYLATEAAKVGHLNIPSVRAI
jgi:hypothetical protein